MDSKKEPPAADEQQQQRLADVMAELLALSRIDQEAADGKTSEQQPKGEAPSFRRLAAQSKPEWCALSLAVLLAAIIIGLDLLTPAIRAILDNIILYPHIDKVDLYGIVYFDVSMDKARELGRFTALAMGIRGCSFALGIVKAVIFGMAGERVVTRMRLMLFSAILKQDMSFFDQRTSGELSSRLGSDAALVQFVATMSIPDMILSMIRILMASVMMFSQDWELGLMVLSLIPLVFLYMAPLTVIVGRLNREYQDAKAVSANIATQAVSNARVVFGCGAEGFAASLYGHAVGDPKLPGLCCWWPKPAKTVYRIGVVKTLVQQLMIQGSITIGSTGVSFVMWRGYNKVIDAELTYGAFGAFIGYALIIGFNVGLLAHVLVNVTNAKGASQRIFEIIDRQPVVPSRGGETLLDVEGDVCFENVNFSYPSRTDVSVFHGLSFSVPAQSKAAFVGASGSGKSTVFALLQRLYDVSEGRVLLDGRDVRDLDAGMLRRRVAVVQQEPVLFGFSITENILFGSRAGNVAENMDLASSDDVVEAAKMANAHDFIMSFPEGYDTLVGERGVRLSGGQKQRIAIARTVIRKPRVLLLDEATSALDSASEHLVQDAIDKMMSDRTVLIVAHRLSTVIDADQIMVMTKDGIADTGRHEELLERCHRYKELVQRQLMQASDGDAPEEHNVSGNTVEVSRPSVASGTPEATTPAPVVKPLDSNALEELVTMTKVDNIKSSKASSTSNEDDSSVALGPKPKSVIGYFFRLSRPELPGILGMVMFTLCSTCVEAYLPIVNGEVVNMVVGPGTVQEKKENTAIIMTNLILVNFGIQAVHLLRVIVCAMAGERIVARVRQQIFTAIFRQEIAFLDEQTSGALTSRLTADTDMIQMAAASGIIEAFVGTVKAGAALTMAFYASWQLSLMALAVGPAMACVLCLPAGGLMRISVRYNDALARSSHIATEATGGMKTVISFGSEEFVQLLYGSSVGRLNGPGMCCWWPRRSQSTYRYGVQRSVAMRVLGQVAMWLAMSIMNVVMWYAYSMILDGQLTFGDITAFSMQVMNIGQGFASIGGSIGIVVAARAALQRIFEIHAREPAFHSDRGNRPSDLKMEVKFEDVCFSYPSRPGVSVLEGLSFKVPANTTAAFVGASGSGKSTVLSLLARVYDVSSGHVTVGGHPVTSLDASWFRRRIGIVQQEPLLFGFNVRENIAYGRHAACFAEGRPQVTDEEVEKAAKLANAHEFITEFPQGYKTKVGERGVLLSGGQKQRVAIARALLGEPRILLLDEATSALDAESEYLVQEAIDKAMHDRTVFLVAHRLSTVRNADQILVMADKHLVDAGTHEELFDRCSCYQDLVNRQMRRFSIAPTAASTLSI